jgi:hypothetical protein
MSLSPARSICDGLSCSQVVDKISQQKPWSLTLTEGLLSVSLRLLFTAPTLTVMSVFPSFDNERSAEVRHGGDENTNIEYSA